MLSLEEAQLSIDQVDILVNATISGDILDSTNAGGNKRLCFLASTLPLFYDFFSICLTGTWSDLVSLLQQLVDAENEVLAFHADSSTLRARLMQLRERVRETNQTAVDILRPLKEQTQAVRSALEQLREAELRCFSQSPYFSFFFSLSLCAF